MRPSRRCSSTARLCRGNCRAWSDLATYRKASDKEQILEMARASGFGGPLTRVIDRPGTHLDREFDDMFPAVIKPHRSVVTVQGVRRKLAVGTRSRRHRL